MKSFALDSCIPSNLLGIEIEQCLDEGKDVLNFKNEAFLIKNIPDIRSIEREKLATKLFLKLQTTLHSCNYPFLEPNDWASITSNIKNSIYIRDYLPPINKHVLFDRIHGGILGKCIGCLLGKPIEGWPQSKIISFLQETNNFPIKKYLFDGITSQHSEKYGLDDYQNFPMNGMPEDDDINYLLIAFKLIDKFGFNFTPVNVAETWINFLPIHRLCTGERIAYRNFVNGIYPPESALFCNPYREWIGAQIRADFFGYICPGNPMLAMALSWKDACISHVKNGIYGALWVSVIIALVSVRHSFECIIKTSLNFIPEKSRFYLGITNVMRWHREKISLENALSKIHATFSEHNIHHWCHVVPNAMIVAIALLWGGKNFQASLQIALIAGFDTDSNAATVGSILGYAIGADAIPHYWKNALKNCIFSPISGETNIEIITLANKACDLIAVSI